MFADKGTFMRKCIYLDIDGVLLTVKNKRIAADAIQFITFVTSEFDCYWLTTHCKGDTIPTMAYLQKFFPKDVCVMLSKIKPTHWDTLKTEGIDFQSDFYWIEDYPFEAEKIILKEHGMYDRLIVVTLNNNRELLRILGLLKQS